VLLQLSGVSYNEVTDRAVPGRYGLAAERMPQQALSAAQLFVRRLGDRDRTSTSSSARTSAAVARRSAAARRLTARPDYYDRTAA
jgi:hypothetical protein